MTRTITVKAGDIVHLEVWTDLWMRGATSGRVTSIRKGFVYLAPIVGGHELNSRHRVNPECIIESKRFGSHASP